MLNNPRPNLSGPALVYFGPVEVNLASTSETIVGVLPDGANRIVPLEARVVFHNQVGTLTTAAAATIDDGTAGHTIYSSTTFTAAEQDRVFPLALAANAYTITDQDAPFTFRVTTASVGETTTFRERTDNIATLTTSGAHGLAVGDIVTITGITGDNSYNQQNATVISVPSATTFTYYAEGADEASTADTDGVLSSGTVLVYMTGLLY